ncbi:MULTISPECIES: cellulose synthase operon protein YhjQ/BcsQ [unclassified Undibacterium]|uniref:nucleotide-binding protein n=1 Tax=unclassified Undibacterium TaxID=2630295 RepID=UPI002AC9A023|nr:MULTISPECIES: cellulose synthase operon protein YhjQ/BcsQ [unclassified Undibacterium]MEB0138471.1 cellulose synthase operon protein YhjQ/BcsQ [Undibacterium sp. CCC2.1]MEB0173129.1 cellulose synthase operon protein YhjQ/BcsQ [Undibacterium sp. CCC1.1]MEB0177519.1 cellulose synthase operon protein YhjQ/BcsQ [Undibacterium sp. CCC3.4]MEB0216165.1 cellulose synthase operon protein YhjQ/BcsQ [Undibacterium sp. 5I2]WPX42786.1 cellulose synthase operon protein YhjQ/BcsQ [Undibacterium sp. CCC3.4
MFESEKSAPSENPAPLKIGRLGDLFLQRGRLSADQVEQIFAQQQQKKMRFGDAALSLGLLTQTEIDAALGEQFGFGGTELLTGVADPKLRFFHAPFSREAEEIRRLRSELLLKFSASEKIRIALVSAGVGEGKTYMAASLAIALSQLGRRTLLVDADMRSGNLHELFALPTPDGLSSVLAGRIPLSAALIPLLPNLQFLPAGPRVPNPLEILRVPRIGELLLGCHEQFDAVIFDSHSAAAASDAQMLAHQVGAVLLVAQKDRSLFSDLRGLKEEMQSAGVAVIGTIYNQHEEVSRVRRWWNYLPFFRRAAVPVKPHA